MQRILMDVVSIGLSTHSINEITPWSDFLLEELIVIELI
jgi:hypothetical protein